MEQLLSGNWVDLLIIAILIFYIIEGYGMGFIRGISDFLGFIFSFIIAFQTYGFIAGILIREFSLGRGISNAVGFFITAFLSELVLSYLFALAFHKTLEHLPKRAFSHKANRWLGIVPGLATGFLLITFFLSLIMTLPVSGQLKASLSQSRIGSYLTVQGLGFEKAAKLVFGEAASEALNFLTIAPRSEESVDLNFKVTDFTADPVSEEEMLGLVNKERVKQGLKPVIADADLQKLARAHAKDMFTRGYFSHYTPEGLSPFDRMANSDISFRAAGENLALAPNTQLAHKGLMESKGHRENILSNDFGRLGVGVIDGGVYGKMFVQEFTD